MEAYSALVLMESNMAASVLNSQHLVPGLTPALEKFEARFIPYLTAKQLRPNLFL